MGHAGGGEAKERDPFLRFLLGCAIVVGGLAALVLGGCGFFAWRLMRDETPGRPVETILAGDENRYWCFDLDPEDEGLVALLDRIDRVNAESRRRALENTPLRGLPIPTRRADVHEVLPLKLELALDTREGGEFPRDVEGWVGRAVVSKGGLRMRAGLKLMRFIMSRDPKSAEVFDVEGVKVTVLHSHRTDIAFANVGNRILFADGVDRLRRMLTTPALEGGPPSRASLEELHAAVRLPGEDGWAFATNTVLEGPSRPLPLDGAVASFDLTAGDDLEIRVAVPASPGAGLPALSAEEGVAIVRSFLLGRGEDWVEAGAPVLEGGRTWRIDGKVSGLTERLSKIVSESASANPTEPSPEPTSDPRSDTPEGPTRGGSPTPER